jgi:hypothetical protein
VDPTTTNPFEIYSLISFADLWWFNCRRLQEWIVGHFKYCHESFNIWNLSFSLSHPSTKYILSFSNTHAHTHTLSHLHSLTSLYILFLKLKRVMWS